MTTTKYIPILLIAFFLALGGCSFSSHSGEARERAEKAAKDFIKTDHTDTIELEKKILEAKSIQGEYAILGDSDAVRAFDEAFREYIKKNDAALAASMF